MMKATEHPVEFTAMVDDTDDIQQQLIPAPFIVKAAANEHGTLFLSREGKVWFSGKIAFGFNRSTGQDKEEILIPEPITLPESIRVKDISIGDNHFALLTDQEKVYLSGKSYSGALGMGENVDEVLQPILLATHHNIKKVSIGYAHTLFLTETGKVYGCGSNSHCVLGIKQLSQEDSIYRPQLVIALANKNVVDIVAGPGQGTFFLTDEGRVYSCGSGMRNVLGYKLEGYGILPLLVEALQHEIIVKIVSVFNYSVFLTNAGEVYGCGNSFPDPVTDGSKKTYEPKKVVKFCEEPIIQIAASYDQICYLTASGYVYKSSKKEPPKLIPDLLSQGKITCIASGEFHFIFITSDGGVLVSTERSHGLVQDKVFKPIEYFMRVQKEASAKEDQVLEKKQSEADVEHNIQPTDEELFDDIGDINMAIISASQSSACSFLLCNTAKCNAFSAFSLVAAISAPCSFKILSISTSPLAAASKNGTYS